MVQYILPQTNWQFPESVHRVLSSVAQISRTDIATGITPFMSTISTLAQAKFVVSIKNASGNGFKSEISTFWICVADSSDGKGPAYEKIADPITDLVVNLNARIAEKNKKVKTRNDSLTALIKGKRAALKKVPPELFDEAIDEITALEEQKEPVADAFVFSTQDATAAGLADLLAGQEGNRTGILDPEGRAIQSILGDKSLQALLNQAYDGEEANNTRASRPSLYGLKPHVSLGLVLQPDKLSRLAKHSHLWGEGFFPRVLPVFPVSFAGRRPPLGVTYDQSALSWYAERVKYLFEYPWGRTKDGKLQAHTLELGQDAFSVWHSYAQRLEQAQSLGSPLAPLKSWLGKAATATARIAALYHLFECQGDPVTYFISGNHMRLAVSFIENLIPHVQILYEQVFPNPLMIVVKKICNWLHSHFGTTDYFTLRELYRSSGLRSDNVQPAINYLSQLNAIYPWIACEAIPEQPGFGRPMSRGYKINFPILQQISMSITS